MAKLIGMPDLNIIFTGLGATAVRRGSKGQVILLVKDEKPGKPFIKLYSVDDLTKEIIESFSTENITNIKDVLSGTPKELVVIRVGASEGMSNEGSGEVDALFNPTTILEGLKLAKTQAEINCWIGIADATEEEDEDLVSFVKSQNKNNKRKYKALGFRLNAPDDMHVVNFTTENIKYKGDDNIYSGKKYIPKMLGALAGQSLDMSLIAREFEDLELVSEPEDLDEAVDNGELFLFNDEGSKVRVGRAVNSLTTTGQGITIDMRFILIVEVMDLIYTDIYHTWNNDYKGRYKNILDNQMLLIAAINAYFQILGEEYLLDPNFDNKCTVDVFAQKMANIPKYGEEEVNNWDNNTIMEMTVGTHVYLRANIKIPNTIEDLDFEIFF